MCDIVVLGKLCFYMECNIFLWSVFVLVHVRHRLLRLFSSVDDAFMVVRLLAIIVLFKVVESFQQGKH